jgi:hypothetical protein
MNDMPVAQQKVNLWEPNPNHVYVYVIRGMDGVTKAVTHMWLFAPFEISIERNEGYCYARVEPWILNFPLPESDKNYGEMQLAFHLTPEIKQWNRFEYMFMKLDREKRYTITVDYCEGQKEFTGTPKEVLAAYIHHVRIADCMNTVHSPDLKVKS